jgi:uncharacterized protein YcfJ
MSMQRGKLARLASCTALSGGLMLMGCAGDPNGIDKSDACGVEHAKFVESKDYYFHEVAKDVVFGALGGAALGALTAGITGNDVRTGALTGAAAGAVAGGAVGVANAEQQQAADQAAAANALYGDIDHASQQLDRTSTTFVLLRDCRFTAAQRIKEGYRQHALSREQAQQQLADQKKRFDEEVVLARQYGTKMADQDQKFRTISDKLVQQDPDAQAYMQTRAARIQAAENFTPDYVVTAAIALRADPNADSEEVAELERDQPVQLDSEGRSGSWRKIVIEDGRSGYVSSRSIKRKPAEKKTGKAKTASAEAEAAPQTRKAAPKPPVDSDNADVKAAVAATETMPEKRVAYSKSVDDAAQQSNLTFNLDQGAPTT